MRQCKLGVLSTQTLGISEPEWVFSSQKQRVAFKTVGTGDQGMETLIPYLHLT